MNRLICGRCFTAPDDGYYEFRWAPDAKWTTSSTTKYGTTNFGIIQRTTNTVPRLLGTQCRIHLCKALPCLAMWPTTKYGIVGPPIHLSEVPQDNELFTVAESPSTAAGSDSVDAPVVVEKVVVE